MHRTYCGLLFVKPIELCLPVAVDATVRFAPPFTDGGTALHEQVGSTRAASGCAWFERYASPV